MRIEIADECRPQDGFREGAVPGGLVHDWLRDRGISLDAVCCHHSLSQYSSHVHLDRNAVISHLILTDFRQVKQANSEKELSFVPLMCSDDSRFDVWRTLVVAMVSRNIISKVSHTTVHCHINPCSTEISALVDEILSGNFPLAGEEDDCQQQYMSMDRGSREILVAKKSTYQKICSRFSKSEDDCRILPCLTLADTNESSFTDNFTILSAWKEDFLSAAKEGTSQESHRSLLKASLISETIRVSSKKAVKMANLLSQDATRTDGCFMMYNHSRISCILTQFHQKVHQGFYDALPDSEDLDFGSNFDAEWPVVKLCLEFPALLSFIVRDVLSGASANEVDIPVHLLISYLGNLCRKFSAYYNRYKVLQEPRNPEIVDVIYKRIYLLKIVQKILTFVLEVFEIAPLGRM